MSVWRRHEVLQNVGMPCWQVWPPIAAILLKLTSDACLRTPGLLPTLPRVKPSTPTTPVSPEAPADNREWTQQ